MPLVELEICDELSQGISAVKVEFLSPVATIFLRNLSQSKFNLVLQKVSTSFFVGVNRHFALCIVGIAKAGQAPNSDANLLDALRE